MFEEPGQQNVIVYFKITSWLITITPSSNDTEWHKNHVNLSMTTNIISKNLKIFSTNLYVFNDGQLQNKIFHAIEHKIR